MIVDIHLQSGTRYATIKIQEEDGTWQEKTVSVSDVREAFQVKEKKQYFWMNPFFDGYEKVRKVPGLIYGEEIREEVKGMFFLPAERRYMDFAGEKSVLPYPSMLFVLHSEGGRLRLGRCFALKEKGMDSVSLGSRLYAFPFGNVNPDNAQICWGSNVLTDLHGYDGLRTAMGIFFSSESNTDYIQAGRSFKSHKTYQEFLRILREKDVFPAKTLVPSGYVRTVRDLMNTMQIKKEEEDV